MEGNLYAYPPVSYREAILSTEATFQVKNTKLYAPVVTLFINDNIKFLEQWKQEFQRAVSWNKHKSEIKAQETTI